MLKVLPSGTVVDVVDGVAEILECGWLIQVPSGCPEPDSEADLWRLDPCPEKVKSLDGTFDHTTCANGHVRHTYGSPEWQADDLEFEARQRAEGI